MFVLAKIQIAFELSDISPYVVLYRRLTIFAIRDHQEVFHDAPKKEIFV